MAFSLRDAHLPMVQKSRKFAANPVILRSQ